MDVLYPQGFLILRPPSPPVNTAYASNARAISSTHATHPLAGVDSRVPETAPPASRRAPRRPHPASRPTSARAHLHQQV